MPFHVAALIMKKHRITVLPHCQVSPFHGYSPRSWDAVIFKFMKAEFDRPAFRAGASHTAHELHGRGNATIFNFRKAEIGRPAFRAGDGGSRTRVRKPIHATFSGCRPSFVFPACIPGGQGTQVGSPFVRDGYKSELTVHGRHSFYAVVK